jgi:hypothetical protein
MIAEAGSNKRLSVAFDLLECAKADDNYLNVAKQVTKDCFMFMTSKLSINHQTAVPYPP